MERSFFKFQTKKQLKNLVVTGASTCLLAALLLTSCTQEDLASQEEILKSHEVKAVLEPWEAQVVRLTKKMRRYHNFRVAQAQGYTEDLTGYIPNMGHHYAKEALIDGTFELEHPEALLYIPDGNGGWQFVAVEYLVLMEDPNNPPPAPEGFEGSEDVWAIVGPFWTLHAWVGLENPDGVFHPTNQNVP